MNLPDLPAPDDARKELGPLLNAIWAALEAGTQQAREFFESQGRPLDLYLASHLTRWAARDYLETKGPDITECALELDSLAFSGLSLVYLSKYAVRIRKASNGQLPVPGYSQILQDFYKQTAFGFMAAEDGKKTAVPLVSVMVLWETNSKYVLQENLILSCPKAGDVTRSSVEDHWSIPIPHPALSVDSLPPHHDGDDDLGITPKGPDEIA